MKLLTVGVALLLLTGCTSLSKDREVICKVECTECKKLAHSCTGTRITEEIEITRN